MNISEILHRLEYTACQRAFSQALEQLREIYEISAEEYRKLASVLLDRAWDRSQPEGIRRASTAKLDDLSTERSGRLAIRESISIEWWCSVNPPNDPELLLVVLGVALGDEALQIEPFFNAKLSVHKLFQWLDRISEVLEGSANKLGVPAKVFVTAETLLIDILEELVENKEYIRFTPDEVDSLARALRVCATTLTPNPDTRYIMVERLNLITRIINPDPMEER